MFSLIVTGYLVLSYLMVAISVAKRYHEDREPVTVKDVIMFVLSPMNFLTILAFKLVSSFVDPDKIVIDR